MSLACGPLARSLRQYTVLSNRPTYLDIVQPPIYSSKRNASTQHDGTNKAQKEEPHRVNEEHLNPPSTNVEEHVTTGVEDGSKPATFTITPKFHWRWRWTYPRSEKGVPVPEKKESTVANDSNHFLPIRSDQHQDKVQSIIGSLSELVDEVRIPLSPLEKGLEEKEWKPKRQPTEQEKMRLSYNPWATMLAGRMRLDCVSKVRLPEPLLLPLGEVASPDKESVYLLPDDLANLEAYDKRLQKALRRLAMVGLPHERGGGKVHILPYKLLVEELTEELVVWDNKAMRGRTKHGVIAKRLLPTRWLERASRITSYQTASSEYWKLKLKEGEMDDPFFKKPEKPVDLLALQWQPNVAERILSVMRQRLILSVDHLGRKTDKPSDQSWRHFTCFEWPKSLCLDLIIGSNKKLGFLPGVYEKPEYAGSEYDEIVEHRKTQAERGTPEDESLSSQAWAPHPLTYRLNDPDFWLPGSYFLHIGPPETTQTALPSFQEHETLSEEQFPTLTSISKLTPPMIAVNKNIRLPVFNLPALLGPKFDHPLHQILTSHHMVLPKNNGDDDSSNKNYLIHVRATAPGSHFILKELWQLWRYVGGTDCLQPPGTTQSVNPEAKTDVRRQKDRIKEYSMSKKVWDNLYAFLPGIERKPPDS